MSKEWPKCDDWTTPPGDSLRVWMKENKVTVEQFAIKIDKAEMWVEDLLSGKIKIDFCLTDDLQKWTEIDYKFWQDREHHYRSALKKSKEKNSFWNNPNVRDTIEFLELVCEYVIGPIIGITIFLAIFLGIPYCLFRYFFG